MLLQLLLGLIAISLGEISLRRLGDKGQDLSGVEAIEKGHQLFARNKLDEAAEYYWHAIMRVDQTKAYTAPEVFTMFMSCFGSRDKMEDGYLLVAEQYLLFRQFKQGFDYINTALRLKPDFVRAHVLWAEYADIGGKTKQEKETHLTEALKHEPHHVYVRPCISSYWIANRCRRIFSLPTYFGIRRS